MDQKTVNYYSQNAQQVADRYEAVVSGLSEHFVDAYKPNSKVLDIGCGSGRDLAVLHKLGHQCYGIDPTPEFVEIAQQVHPELSNHIAQGSLPEMAPPFGGKFDGVLCSAVLMHIDVDQLHIAASSIKSCLKIGGRLLYSVPSKRLDVVSENRDVNGRLFIPDQSGRLQAIFEGLGFECISKWGNADSMGRDSVEWESVLLELKN
jgi:2-polyprenyl-3-methyl-5-hydroxy-6-metoxy-1,4-benzoquinol methylase